MTRRFISLCAALAATISLAMAPAVAAKPVPLSGALFTTDISGVPVNLNIYQAKEDVYLNGGPGINAPVDAAGLPAGTYAFQVTDPSGVRLLSTDPVACRQVSVDSSGRFQSVAASGSCAHATSTDGEDLGITVQLFPYDDTPNNGGVYKVWITPFDKLNCGAPGAKHCFVPDDSKTDNFKVRVGAIVEIDTRFHAAGSGALLDGMKVTWTDTVGASNVKYSEYAPERLAFHEAHVEAAESGTHQILIQKQAGCAIGYVVTPTGKVLKPSNGSVKVSVVVADESLGDATYWVDVYCA